MPTALITNDDGIECHFLWELANAASAHFDVYIAAPSEEQSWIGRAMSRRRAVGYRKVEHFEWPAWAIDGTPTDCVNIAMSSLLNERPDVVLSGINIGYNTSIPLIFSSGTVAGALEGAFWNIHAFAISQAIHNSLFEDVTRRKGELPDAMKQILKQSANHAIGVVRETIKQPVTQDCIVHNLNYPPSIDDNLVIEETVPARMKGTGFYEEKEDNHFHFRYTHGEMNTTSQRTDRAAIADNHASHTILNFSRI